MAEKNPSAVVFHITRASFHDGDGLRTVVYLKGCPLRCRWCHNPEGLSGGRSILFRKERCIGCGRCLAVCPEHHILQEGNHVYLREGCISCGECAEACPNEALSLCGEERTAEEVFQEVAKDKMYYERTQGGVTVSGGECLLYPEFVVSLLERCKEVGIHTCVESAFYLPWANIEVVLPWLDTLIVDMKHADDNIHRKLTGHGNRQIIQNIDTASRRHFDMWIRIPLIPGINDDKDNLRRTAEIINTFGEGIRYVELLKYNPMAGGKYTALGQSAKIFGDPQTDEAISEKRAIIREILRKSILVRE